MVPKFYVMLGLKGNVVSMHYQSTTVPATVIRAEFTSPLVANFISIAGKGKFGLSL